MKVYAGIDCGGTSTRVALVTAEGHVLGSGRGGSSNPNAVGEQSAADAIRTAYTAAESVALAGGRGRGGERFELAGLFMGMAGIVGDKELPVARSILSTAGIDVTGVPHGIDHDIRIALAGGLGKDEGVALIVGTGSSCYGRTHDGRTHQAGGWGNVLDDMGSAYDLGHRAMCAAVRIADGRHPASPLLDGVMYALNLKDTREIVEKVYRTGMGKAEVATLAGVTLSAWRRGDVLARQIVETGIHELVLCVETVARKLEMLSADVCFTGGLVENAEDYRNALIAEIQRRLPGANVAAALLPPVLGAAILALHAGGVEVTNNLRHRLGQSFHDH